MTAQLAVSERNVKRLTRERDAASKPAAWSRRFAARQKVGWKGAKTSGLRREVPRCRENRNPFEIAKHSQVGIAGNRFREEDATDEGVDIDNDALSGWHRPCA